MPSGRYRKNAEECLNRAVAARSQKMWLLIAEEWLRLAVSSNPEQYLNNKAEDQCLVSRSFCS
jgi:hypothetical protein